MDSLPEGFANRCLPLRIANESGWFILNSHTFTVLWEGYGHQDSLRVEYQEGEKPYPAGTNFGNGILTFKIPYLFRTSSGWNLHVRGPANMPKYGVSPLEGIVETDWSPYTFTMNWQVLEPFEEITFKQGEPICQVVPVKRGMLEEVEPELYTELDGEIKEQFESWEASRIEFWSRIQQGCPIARKQGWTKDYFQGRVHGARVAEHETKLKLKEFIS